MNSSGNSPVMALSMAGAGASLSIPSCLLLVSNIHGGIGFDTTCLHTLSGISCTYCGYVARALVVQPPWRSEGALV